MDEINLIKNDKKRFDELINKYDCLCKLLNENNGERQCLEEKNNEKIYVERIKIAELHYLSIKRIINFKSSVSIEKMIRANSFIAIHRDEDQYYIEISITKLIRKSEKEIFIDIIKAI